jgi:hypothetical protein
MVKTRVDSIERDVKLIVDELLSPAGRSKQFAAAALEFLSDADDTNRLVLGRVPRSKTYVDGREGAALETVKPDGIIVREYELIFDVLVFISDILRTMSPVGRGPDKRPGHPGFFKGSHLLFADGREVAVSESVPDAAEYVFLSSAPYARRIEKRSTVYEMAAAKAAARFGNIARVRFGWRSPILSYVAGGANRAERAAQRNQPAKQSAKHIERATRVPAIIVTIGR